MNRPIAYPRIALCHMLVLLAVSAGDAFAVQIEPNPNPVGNTISIALPTPGENLVPFSNLGAIDIDVNATLRNANRLDNSGTISNGFGGTFSNIGGHVNNQGAITLGRLSVYNQSEHPVTGVPGTTTNSGTFTTRGETMINAGTFANQGSVVNSGVFQVDALGQVSGDGSYEQNSSRGWTIVNGTFGNNIDLQGGILSGTGTIAGFVNHTGGHVQPGGYLPGMLTLTNSYEQGFFGRLGFEIGGLIQGAQYDVLRVSDHVSLDGGLSVTLIDGFVPKVGDNFNLITGSSFHVGQLQTSLPRLLAGMDWLTSFAGGVYSLTVVSAPEPSSLLLSGFGFAWLVGWRWRKQQIRKATN